MRIAVIGGGVSGLTFAINRKRNHPEDEIFVFEHLDKLMKKILATGNGKCNIANNGDLSSIYNDKRANEILNKYNYEAQNKFLDSVNIKTKLVGNLSYPISESAATVRNAYLKEIDSLGVKVYLNTTVIDYSFKDGKYDIKTNNGDFIFDKIVISTGGKSSPKLGSDGSLLPLFTRHGYRLKDFQPALCPIYTVEKTKILDGIRVKANVSLLDNNQIIFNEDGEVLFKDKGLSGMVIFNLSRKIAQNINHKYQIKVDLLPTIDKKELTAFQNKRNKETLLNSYLHPSIAIYLLDKGGDVIENIKSLTFTYDKLYGFDNSQISVGGISLEEINNNLESNREKGVYFIGEVLDIDAPCGGYNLMWAIGSALYISEIM